MSDHIVKMTVDQKEIIILGTAHISQESVDEVRKIIDEEHPDHIGIEIDDARFRTVKDGAKWENMDIAKVLKEGKGFLLLANMALSSFQKRLGAQTGVKPGQEMMTAVEEAEKRGIPYSLCDRDVQITLRRAWGKAGLLSKGKLLSALLGSVFEEEKITEADLKKLKEESSMADLMGQVAHYLPEIKDVLIDERDAYLAEKIRSCPGKKIFAVVGAGHVPGIRAHLMSEIRTDLAPIEALPKKGKIGTVLKWLFPVLIFGLFGYAIFKMGFKGFLDIALIWALVTGGASALGALVTLGHPLTILISFVTAPFTTIHPLIGVAMYSGWVEAVLRKPRVSDFENLNTDLLTVKGFFKNRVTHILIVALGSSIGATLGMVFGVPAITALVGGA